PLEEIARITRVSTTYLHALEADDFSSLPVPVFTRGFVRAYCQALGEVPDEALSLYERRGDPSVPAAAAAPVAPVASPVRSSAPAPGVSSEPVRNRGPVLVSFVLLVVLGIALFAVTLLLQTGRDVPDERRAARVPPQARVATQEPKSPETPA